MYCRRPDEQTYEQRVETLRSARAYLQAHENERHSWERHMETLQDVSNVLEVRYRQSIEQHYTYSQEIPVQKYESCMSTLKMLMIKFKLRMLLYDLININDSI